MQRKIALTTVLLVLGITYLVYWFVRDHNERNLTEMTKQAHTPQSHGAGPSVAELEAIAEKLTAFKVQLESGGRQVTPANIGQFGGAVDAVFGADSTISPEVMQLLKKLPYLKSCSFYDTPLNDEQLEIVCLLDSLESLNLNYTQVTDAGIPAVAKLPQLKTLFLNGDAISNAGLAPLAALSSLTSIGLYKTRINDEGLKTLAGLTQLKSMDIQGTEVSVAGVQELQTRLPDCRIVADPY